MRHLQFLGLLVTEGDSAGGGVSRIQRMASKAQERYPTAVALGGILRTYSQTRQAMCRLEVIANAVQNCM